MTDYKKYQQIFQITSDNNFIRKSLRVSRRSFLGCINCKRKKKKCDETKPICRSCQKGRSKCIWSKRDKKNVKKRSENNELLTNDLSEEKVSYELIQTRNTWDKGSAESLLSEVISSNNNIPLSSDLSLNSFSLWIPGVTLSKQDAYFYYNFVYKFIPSISKPHGRNQLSPKDIFLPAISQSLTLREIFFAGGATLLAFENDFYKEIAHQKYISSLNLLLSQLKEGIVDGSEDWLFMAVQVLQTICLRDKILGFNATRCAQHLSAANKIIERRFMKSSKKLERFMEPSWFLESIKESSESKNISFIDSFPIDRILIENFAFNYSITIFLCNFEELETSVPNPFEFFATYKSWLSLYNLTPGKFFSEDIEGLLYFSYEVAAKCSWICRLWLPLGDADKLVCQNLLESVETKLKKIDILNDNPFDIPLQRNLSIIKVFLRGSIILLRKMVNMDHLRAENFQYELNLLISDIERSYDENLILPCWSLMIGASVAIDAAQQEFFRDQLYKLMHTLNSNTVFSILNYLDAIWKRGYPGEAFESLFDTNILNLVCV